MNALGDKVREAERQLFYELELDVHEQFVQLPDTGLRLRVLTCGSGVPLLLLHGVTLTGAVWAPLLARLRGYRLLAVDLPGHGLSDPVDYAVGHVRAHTVRLMDDLLGALGLQAPAIVGHSLGGMYALWYAAARPGRIGSLIALGDPAVAFPGVRVRMPLSILTVPWLGELTLRAPSPRPAYRALLAQGLGATAAAAVPPALLDALRLAQRRPSNARTVARLMHALNRFRRPRPESVMPDGELRRVAPPTLFIWGRDDPFLSPRAAAPSIGRLPSGTLREVPGGHAPWLDDAAGCARLIVQHLVATGFDPVRGVVSEPMPRE
jgi:pimeloyl-ACP methyl ester carboxylesterase